ncbi:anthranilate synthase component II [Aureimonas frigidaquae]|uniref:anthranilate synthase component II n=1 Tax=Aureimonas frigidaquae TaxID=424757 RepID=UPI000782E3ED|nr:aminodeoxychorismate/anthranilate synthase component II [Aureimonas frigidaquae]
MIVMIDNYDSFVFNLARYLERLGEDVTVLRNDGTDIEGILALSPDAIVISPGPCTPREAGISIDLVTQLSGRLPILGVCLGHQVIGAAFGGVVTHAGRPLHGQASPLHHTGHNLFQGVPDLAQAGRYHSLIVQETPVMAEALVVDARSPEGEIMALTHRLHPTYGIQFHPESVLTPHGMEILANFTARIRTPRATAG